MHPFFSQVTLVGLGGALDLLAQLHSQRPIKHGEYAKRMRTLSTGVLDEVKPLYELGWGRCQCGCGSLTKIMQGKAFRFVAGHSCRTVEARERSSRVGTQVLRSRIGHGTLHFGRSIQGSHFSVKNDRQVSYMSSYEKRAFEILDVLDNVASYEEQPYTISYEIDGVRCQYTPDIIIRFKDKSSALVEVKPRSKLTSQKVVAKACAAIAFCHEKGIQYMIWTEDFLLLQSFKRANQTNSGPLAEFSRFDHIESILKTTMKDIQARLDARRKTIHCMFHPRA